MSLHPYLPHDVRFFVHKRIGRAVVGFVGGGPLAAAAGFVQGSKKRRGGQPAVSLEGARSRFGRTGRCSKGRTRVGNKCVKASAFLPGGTPFTEGAAGVAVMGQYGAALTPLIDRREIRICLPGMVLGKDGNCYNRRDISNKEREWPRGTRPLGTPGEMAALRKAASFGRRMETTVKRMQKIGVLKKPRGRGRLAPRAAPRQIGPGPSIINVE